MRQIGTLTNERDARRFAAYLVTQGIAAHAEADSGEWAVWVRDENHVPEAREAFEDFRRNPDRETYRGVERTAESLLRDEVKQRESAARNVVEMRGRWNRPALRRRPLTFTLIALSVLVFLLSSGGSNQSGVAMRYLLFCDPIHLVDGTFQEGDWQSPLVDVRRGQLWRLITPIFVHIGAMHLAFNMIMFYQLGGVIEDRRGTGRLALMILAIALASNAAQALVPLDWGGTPFAAGMSGVVYGLFGYIWMKSTFAPQMGLLISRSTVMILMIWLLLGITGVLEKSFGLHVANWTHGIGLVAGVAIGYLPEMMGDRSS